MTAQVIPNSWLQSVLIRQITQDDLTALEWQGEFSHFRRVYAEAYERAKRGLAVLWVAENPATGIIAQVFVQLICNRKELADGRNRAYLYSFRVQSEYRRLGLGSRMIRNVESDLIERGFRYLTLNVARVNEDAIRLYLRHGFVIVSEEPGIWSYIDQNGARQTVEEPAWRLEKILI
ncbi:MAG: N-acetyltransferase [Bellilinea sp.]|jgi:ribosomal protein S18 acetylase RimI-like enzyme